MARILFHVIDSVGLGHLSRATAIANAIRKVAPEHQILFMIETADSRLLASNNYGAIQIPPRLAFSDDSRWQHLEPEVFQQMWANLTAAVIGSFVPNLVIYDTFIWPEIKIAADRVGAHQIYVLREAKNMNKRFEDADFLKFLNTLDLLVFPNDSTAFESTLLEVLKVNEIAYYFAGTIIRRTAEEINLTKISQKYQLSSSLPLVVASNGGGNALTPEEPFTQTVIDAARNLVAKGCRFRLIVILGPLQSRKVSEPVITEPWLTMVEYEENLIDLFAASNLVICRGGYNTIAEIKHLKVPTIAVPSKRNTDDQAKRIEETAQIYPTVKACSLSAEAIEKQMETILAQPLWHFEPDKVDCSVITQKTQLAEQLLQVLD